MHRIIALVFNYSLNGLLADEGTDFWTFCFDLLDEQGGASRDDESLDFLSGAQVHLMGRTAYEGMAAHLPGRTDHPWAGILDAGRKVVFSRSSPTADWANTTVVSGDTADEIARIRANDDGYSIVWGGVSLWRSLMRLDLIDEFRISHYPYVAAQGTVLFDEVPPDYRLELVSAAPVTGGVLELHYRRLR